MCTNTHTSHIKYLYSNPNFGHNLNVKEITNNVERPTHVYTAFFCVYVLFLT